MYYLHFDPSICSPNIGDQIISASVKSILENLLPELGCIEYPTQYSSKITHHSIVRKSVLNIVGGTNLITPNRYKFSQWKVPLSFYLNNYKFLLMGVGMHQYKKSFDPLSLFAYKRLLPSHYLHSVRDGYTQSVLSSIGINSINTSCPTLWSLSDKSTQSKIPNTKSSSVLFTLTDYNPSSHHDINLVRTLISNYTDVYFWPQGTNDLKYVSELLNSLQASSKVKILPFGLKSYTDFLLCTNVDYIGTRLHAGIYALKHLKRSLILSIDNRAAEIAKDVNLPVLPRDNITAIKQYIHNQSPLRLELPIHNIRKWSKQLRSDLGLDNHEVST